MRWASRFVRLPLDDYLAALDPFLRGLRLRYAVLLALSFAVSWWVYVPVHELAHALGCRLGGGEVTRLEIDPLYGAALLRRVFPFVAVGSDYAGQLTGFDTRGSDLTYLLTDFLPFVLTIFLGVPLLRSAAAPRGGTGRALCFGAALPLAYAPFISAAGGLLRDGLDSGFAAGGSLLPGVRSGALAQRRSVQALGAAVRLGRGRYGGRRRRSLSVLRRRRRAGLCDVRRRRRLVAHARVATAPRRVYQRPSIRRSHSVTSADAASAAASRRTRWERVASASGSRSRVASQSASSSGRHSSSATQRPPPASTCAMALALWWSQDASAERHDQGGQAAVRQLGQGRRAALRDDEVRPLVGLAHVVDVGDHRRGDSRLGVARAHRGEIARAALVAYLDRRSRGAARRRNRSGARRLRKGEPPEPPMTSRRAVRPGNPRQRFSAGRNAAISARIGLPVTAVSRPRKAPRASSCPR